MTTQSKDALLSSDVNFDNLYPVSLRHLSEIHWTPVEIARVAAAFLAPDENANVIDIGCGVGKFCIVGALTTDGNFTGIELKKNFVNTGNKVISGLELLNASLNSGNFMDVDFSNYTGIYFFNSFHENLVPDEDHCLPPSVDLFDLYYTHFIEVLHKMPTGTRLATYWLSISEIPGCYRMVESLFDDQLKLWIKVKSCL